MSRHAHPDDTSVTVSSEMRESVPTRRVPMTADEEQEARLRAQDRIGESEAASLIANFWADTQHLVVPEGLHALLHTDSNRAHDDGEADGASSARNHDEDGEAPAVDRAPAIHDADNSRVAQDNSDTEAEPASTTARLPAALVRFWDKVTHAVEAAPTAVVDRILPEQIMSQRTKTILFTDFLNTLRVFFHTNALSMPFLFHQAGLVGGLILLTVTAVASEYATEAFFEAKNQLARSGDVIIYGDVPFMVWGKWFPMLNVFYGFTHLMGFEAFTASNARVLLAAMGMTGGGATALSLIIPSLLVLPLVFMKRSRNQKPLGMASNVLVLSSLIMMLAYFPYKTTNQVKLWANSSTDFFMAMGVAVFAFTGIGSCIPVERTMPPAQFKWMLRVSVGIAYCLLTAFGLAGYLSYGSSTCSVMTVSLQDGAMKTALSAVLFVASLVIIPQQTFPFCEVCDRRLLGIRRVTRYLEWRPNVLRIVAIVLCVFAAWIIPYYGIILSISGAFGCGVLGLVVPAGLDYVRRLRRDVRKGRGKLRWWELLAVLALGLFGTVVVLCGVFFGAYSLWITIQMNASSC